MAALPPIGSDARDSAKQMGLRISVGGGGPPDSTPWFQAAARSDFDRDGPFQATKALRVAAELRQAPPAALTFSPPVRIAAARAHSADAQLFASGPPPLPTIHRAPAAPPPVGPPLTLPHGNTLPRYGSPGSRGAAALAPLTAVPEPPELDVRVTADVGPVVAWEGGALIGRFSTTGATLT